MLIKILPNQVVDHWDILSYGIQQSLPPITIESPLRMNNILESLIIGRMDLWLSTEDNKVKGLIVTSITYDKNSDVQDLLIYSLYGYNNLLMKNIKEGLETLKIYARAKGCKRITAYSNVESVIKFMESYGASTFTYLSIPANGEIK
jgi:hypothetical protein